MSTIVTRAGKGSALTHTEVDANFTNLNTDKIEAAQSVTLTNKTISGSNNTLSNIGNSSLTNSSVTIGSTSVSLGSTATTVSGLTLSSPTVNTPTLSGGTINNASVGATTPSSGAFTTLSATGVTTVQAGTAAAPAITTSGDTNTGIFYPAADTVAIGTGGTERLRVDSAGNTGFGVTPSAWSASFRALQVSNFGLMVNPTNGNTYQLANAYFDTGYKYLTSAAALRFEMVGGVYAWSIAPSGTAGNAITFTQAMTLDASGNLGIGTSSPANKLHVVGTAASNIVRAQAASSGDSVVLRPNAAGNGGDVFSVNDAQTAYTPLNVIGSTVVFLSGTGGTERARITSGGYFKATSTGTYSAGTTSTVHEFNASVVDGTIVNFYNQAASLPYGLYVQFTAADPNDATRYVFGAQQNTGVFIYRIYSNGTVAARSDVKWKKNIETARDGYAEDLAKLRVVKYNWYNHEDGTPKELGLIAQEVEQVFPGLVTTDEQTRNEIKTREIPAVLDEEGNEVEPARREEYTEKVGTGEYSKSIKFSVLPIMLLKAVQEQQAMIDELKAKVAALENA